MIGTQLDLFGGPPKPPKKITIEEDQESVNPPSVESPAMPVKESVVGFEGPGNLPASGFAVHVEMPPASNLVFPLFEAKEENIGFAELNEEVIPEEPQEITGVSLEATEIEVFNNLIEDSYDEVDEAEWDTGIETIDVNDEIVQIDDKEPSGQWLEVANEPKEALDEMLVEINNPEELEEEEVGEEPIEVIKIEVNKNITEIFNQDSEFEEAPLMASAFDPGTGAVIEAEGLNIPDNPQLYSRQYYTMRETAAMFNVNQSLIRFWENEFDVLKPKKNRKGDRYFRPDDIKNLELIYHLLKVKKFTINGAKDHLKSNAKLLNTFEMVQRLEKLKSFLIELKTNL